jgi:4-hydroxyphenylpyruvate dioxygenase
MPVPSLGIVRLESLHYYVHDLPRMRRFLCDTCDFAELGETSPEADARSGMHGVVFRAGECTVVVSVALRPDSPAGRFLARHPEGVGELILQVEDAQAAWDLLDGRGGTPTSRVETLPEHGGTWASFAITTPIGDTRFRFVQRTRFDAPVPGFVAHAAPRGGSNRFGYLSWDHITCNFTTLAPFVHWAEQVLGFEPYWKVQFHTEDVAGPRAHGSGLRSIVLWDPRSGVKFANNEPLQPHFEMSQIQLYVDDNRGDGVQHAAILVKDILPSVEGLRGRGVPFLDTPGTYYDMLPARLAELGVGAIDEEISTLRDLGILVDGSGPRSYLLQIFMKEQAGIFGDSGAGPFFLEIIQRKGDRGFGAGNFRALFESIERDQKAAGRLG